MAQTDYRLRLASGVRDIPAAAWDACAFAAPPESNSEVAPSSPLISQANQSLSDGADALESLSRQDDSKSQQKPFNPFVSHSFLAALETAGCVGAKSGWTPAPLVAEDAQGRLLGCAPLYLKTHSQGEYVFDHAWADAYERAGGRYYPKLQITAPFTPVTGPRLLSPAPAIRAILANGARAAAAQLDASSVHVTFPHEAEAQALAAQGWLLRIGEQFQFRNEGYRDYADFLDALASRKRKALKRERREALEGGVEIDWITGSDLTEAHWDAFFAFYMDTGSRKWGQPYLNRAFFSLLGAAMPERILLVMARRGTSYIAGALNLIGDDALYGRYWGALEPLPFLHFELCYHQAIDYALAHGLSRVEAGAQGEHKLARGYRPTPTFSAHHLRDPGLRRAVAEYLARERAQMKLMIEEDDGASPFKKTPAD